MSLTDVRSDCKRLETLFRKMQFRRLKIFTLGELTTRPAIDQNRQHQSLP